MKDHGTIVLWSKAYCTVRTIHPTRGGPSETTMQPQLLLPFCLAVWSLLATGTLSSENPAISSGRIRSPREPGVSTGNNDGLAIGIGVYICSVLLVALALGCAHGAVHLENNRRKNAERDGFGRYDQGVNDEPGDLDVVDELTECYERMKYVSSLCAFTSIYFWTWAMVNIIKTHVVDLGILTFAFALASHIVALMAVGGDVGDSEGSVKFMIFHKNTVFPSHALISANYLAGAFLKPMATWQFQVYCIAFAFLWALSGYGARSLAVKLCALVLPPNYTTSSGLSAFAHPPVTPGAAVAQNVDQKRSTPQGLPPKSCDQESSRRRSARPTGALQRAPNVAPPDPPSVLASGNPPTRIYRQADFAAEADMAE